MLTVTTGYLAEHAQAVCREVAGGLAVRIVAPDLTVTGWLLPGSGQRVDPGELDRASTGEIAVMTGRSPDAIRKRRQRARLRALERLAESGEPGRPAESPGVLTVTAWEARRQFAQMRREAAAGTAVRVVDVQRPSAPPVWITTEPPPWFGSLIEDDTDRVRQAVTSKLAQRQRRVVAEHGLPWAQEVPVS